MPEWVTFTPDNKYLYVSDAALNPVSEIDMPAMKVVKVIQVGETSSGKRASLHYGMAPLAKQAAVLCPLAVRATPPIRPGERGVACFLSL